MLPNSHELLRRWRAAMPEASARLCRAILSGNLDRQVWLFGRNEAAKILLQHGVSCTGVIDDFCSEESWNGLPVRKLVDLQELDAIVINCVQCNSSQEAAAALKAYPQHQILSFSDLFRVGHLDVAQLPSFAAATWQLIEDQPDCYNALWSDFNDQESRRQFADVIGFRLTTDPAFLSGYRYRPQEQYFEQFLAIPKRPVFVDAGAYHGETTLEFAKRYPDYAAIHAFEPSVANAAEFLRQTSHLDHVIHYPVGLSDHCQQLRFSADQGSASKLCEQGGEIIEVKPLDSLLEGPVSFIKMDLEGHELSALRGAINTIQSSRCSLAIGAYHNPVDFVNVSRFIKEHFHGSLSFLRHYTSGWSETVLYAIDSSI